MWWNKLIRAKVDTLKRTVWYNPSKADNKPRERKNRNEKRFLLQIVQILKQ